jgi:hypothetical protein
MPDKSTCRPPGRSPLTPSLASDPRRTSGGASPSRRVYNDFLGCRSPRPNMVAAWREPQNAVHWLLECDLEEESRRLTLWGRDESFVAPDASTNCGLCDEAIRLPTTPAGH